MAHSMVSIRNKTILEAYRGTTLPPTPNVLTVPAAQTTVYFAGTVSAPDTTFYVEDITKKKNPYKDVTYDAIFYNKTISLHDWCCTLPALYAKGWLSSTCLASALIVAPTPREIAEILTLPLHTVQPLLHTYSAIRASILNLPNVTLLEAPNIEEVESSKYHIVTLIERQQNENL